MSTSDRSKTPTAGADDRPVAVTATIDEFRNWVTLLAETAGLIRSDAQGVAEHLTLEEATQLVARLDEIRDIVQASTDPLSRQIAEVWEAGRDAVIEVADLQVKVHHSKDRREWDHTALAHEVVRRRMAGLAAADRPAPTPYDVADWLLAAMLPSYWRKQVVNDLGIDLQKFSKGRDERPRGHVRKRAAARQAAA